MYSILFIVFILWSPYVSGLSQKFKQEERDTLSQLDKEAQKTKLEVAWERSKSLYKKLKTEESKKSVKEVYRDNGTLNEGEIRILISYCDESNFYRDLNEDLRDNVGRRYPVATKVVREALTKLKKIQRVLHTPLYRAENISLFGGYQQLFKSSKSGVLKQFTSTSTSLQVANKFKKKDSKNLMITKFEDPQIGASIADFSIFNECEVLLPVNGMYTVKTATKCNGEFNVVLSGPRNRARRSVQSSGDNNSNFVCSGNIKHNSNTFIIFVSVLIIKLV